MPYRNTSDLPNRVKDNLPKHAQEIFQKAYNNAWEGYKNKEKRREDATREEVVNKVAWAAVKNEYEKKNGKWSKKD